MLAVSECDIILPYIFPLPLVLFLNITKQVEILWDQAEFCFHLAPQKVTVKQGVVKTSLWSSLWLRGERWWVLKETTKSFYCWVLFETFLRVQVCLLLSSKGILLLRGFKGGENGPFLIL